jgi:hypothetical protein
LIYFDEQKISKTSWKGRHFGRGNRCFGDSLIFWKGHIYIMRKFLIDQNFWRSYVWWFFLQLFPPHCLFPALCCFVKQETALISSGRCRVRAVDAPVLAIFIRKSCSVSNEIMLSR